MSNSQFYLNVVSKPTLMHKIKSIRMFARRVEIDAKKFLEVLSPDLTQRYITIHREIDVVDVQRHTRLVHHVLRRSSVLPKQVVVAMTDARGFVGDNRVDPFKFLPTQARNICLHVDGEPYPTAKISFENMSYQKRVCQPYFHFLLNSGHVRNKSGSFLSLQKYADCPLLVFDLTPELCNLDHMHVKRIGELAIHMDWQMGLSHAITMIVMMSNDQVISIKPRDGHVSSEIF